MSSSVPPETAEKFPLPTPAATLQDEYLSSRLTVEAFKRCFRKSFPALVSHNDSSTNKRHQHPEGLELLYDRSNDALAQGFEVHCEEFEQRVTLVLEKLTNGLRERQRPQGANNNSNDVVVKPSAANKRKERMLAAAFNQQERVTTTATTLAVPKDLSKRKKARKYCCVYDCSGNDLTAPLTRVPPLPPKPLPGARAGAQVTYAVKTFTRQEVLERLGMKRTAGVKDARFCKTHPFEEKEATLSIGIQDENGNVYKTEMKKVTVFVPKPLGRPFSDAPGVARQQQAVSVVETSDSVTGTASLPVEALDLYNKEENAPTNKVARMIETVKQETFSRQPIVNLTILTPEEVFRRTGYIDVVAMLSQAAIYCAGDIELLTKTCSVLTWLEEWCLFFEKTSGGGSTKACSQWSAIVSSYGLSQKSLRKVVRWKQQLVVATRNRWSEDATSAEEDWDDNFQ